MSGTTIPLITKREYDFDAGAATVVIMKAVRVEQYTEALLELRVHANSVTSSSTIDLKAYTTAPTDEDPSNDFVASTSSASAQITSSTAAPGLVVVGLTANFGGFLKITLEGTPSGGTCTATVSANLVLKD